MKWNKIVNGPLETAIEKKLTEIVQCLDTVEESKETISLLGGKAGIALFYFYYSRFKNEEKYFNHGYNLLSETFDAINDGFSYHTYCGGIGGVAWTVEHLVQQGFLEANTEEIIGELDAYLHKSMLQDMQQGNYDFLHGAVGNGVYFLSRLQNPNSRNYIKELIDELEKQSEKDAGGGIKWLAVLNHEKGTKGYNLSLSHGLASIIVFLSKALEQGIYPEKVTPLLNECMKYMLDQKQDFQKFRSHFPSWICPEEPSSYSRIAWCYGDLGLGLAIFQAARASGNSEWERIAIEALTDAATRKTPEESGVVDAGICHGAAGNAHLFNRAYHYTGIEDFRETALHWIDQTLKLATFDDGFAGYKAYRTPEYGGWQKESSILEGIAGIGLTLLTTLGTTVPEWDRCLLIS